MFKFFNSLIWSVAYALIYFTIMHIVAIFILYIFKITGYVQSSDPLTLYLNFNRALYPLVIIVSILLFNIIINIRSEKFLDFCKFNKTDDKLIFYCIILTFGLIPIISIIAGFLNLFFKSYNETSKAIQVLSNDPIMILFLIVFIPIMEEIVFRGLILNEIINSTKNYRLAIVFQAVLFGIFHGNIVQGIYAFILGIVLGSIAYIFNSIYLSIIMHCIFNLMGSIVIVKISNITNSVFINNIFVIILFIIQLICLKIAISFFYKEIKINTNKDRFLKNSTV